MHGGVTAPGRHGGGIEGPDHPNWKHGRYSKETARKEGALRDMVRDWQSYLLSKEDDAAFEAAMDAYYAEAAKVNDELLARGEKSIRPRFQIPSRYRDGYTGDRPQCQNQRRDENGRFR